MWWRPLNAIRVTHRSHNQIVFQMIAAASYSNSHNNCKVAKLNALYMRHVGAGVAVTFLQNDGNVPYIVMQGGGKLPRTNLLQHHGNLCLGFLLQQLGWG